MKTGNKKKFWKQLIAVIVAVCMMNGFGKVLLAQAAFVTANTGNQTFCVGYYFTAFIKEDNSLWTAGGSGIIGSGEIISGTEKEQGNWMQDSGGVPIKVMDDVKSVYTDGDMTCYAIKTDNSLWAWGVNNGAFGDGSMQSSKTPVKIMDDVTFVSSMEYSWYSTETEGQGNHIDGHAVLALKSDGTLWSWGTNLYGEVGDGSKQQRLSPVKIMDNVVCAMNNKVLISMTDDVVSTYAIKSDASLWAWGSNYCGQLGDGTSQTRLLPVKIMENVQAFDAYSGACAAIQKDSSYWSWGSQFLNSEGGKIHYTMVKSPKKIADNIIFAKADDLVRYFIKNDKSLWAWGTAPKLDLTGSGQSFNSEGPIPILTDVRAVYNENVTNFAIQADNSLWGWGSNSMGQIGIGIATSEYQKNLIKVMDGVAAVSTSLSTTIILKTDGTLWGCGEDRYCQLGQGTYGYERAVPVQIAENVKLP